MKLSDLAPGERATVTSIDTSEVSALRLMTLGIIEGSEVRCLSKLAKTIEIDIYGMGFAISIDMADKFICEKYGNS